jgi:hypothetical protein
MTAPLDRPGSPPTLRTQSAERDRLSTLLAITLFSATLFRFIELPTRTWAVRRVLGSPLSLAFGGDWLLTLLLMGLVATGTLSLLQLHPLREQRERPLVFALITPTLGALLAALLLIQAVSWPLWLITLLVSGVLIGLLVHLSHEALSTEQPGYPSARTLLNIADYLLGFVLFNLILRTQMRALIVGPAILLLSGTLALDLLSASGVRPRAVLHFSGIIALLESELAWVLSYWPISSWTAATLLTVGLYMMSGVSYQHLLGRLERRIILEFGAVALLMFLLVLWVRP